MAEIIKFPEQPPTCGDCGKPLEFEEGKVCPVEGCETVGCGPCTEVSTHCLDHMELDPILCPETEVEDIKPEGSISPSSVFIRDLDHEWPEVKPEDE